ncbi:ornithine cyclodeaminase family protein [Alkalimonas collagenimarina]|uniref:Ornithine cyclodeaminase family protein n=1 Tax=Alkalimonas collagenimarina TaxID=400390 RepID=A0ABT9GVA6_9GAMM|nr:ornithine cyclodeaminase family protein [Alkalimonas collagenimarina]MDP4534640.1 ornithine cyclodeaminase family protein [Alkalimonas collagenimarina]
MQLIQADSIHQTMQFPPLIASLRQSFAGDFGMPARQLLPLTAGQPEALALLPAWDEKVIGCKLFTYFPQNPAQGKERLHAKIMLFCRHSGEPLALLDGTSITLWRTAAISALAGSYLANPAASTLVLFGTGKLAPYLVKAYASIRQLDDVYIVGRDPAKAQQLAASLQAELQTERPALRIQAAERSACLLQKADIICCATAATEPLFPADWVQPGTLVDALGNHHANCSEIDTQLVVDGLLYVDSRANCLNEAGEILLPLQAEKIQPHHIRAELAELCRNDSLCWQADRIQVFKAVGTALADLAAARLMLEFP